MEYLPRPRGAGMIQKINVNILQDPWSTYHVPVVQVCAPVRHGGAGVQDGLSLS